jgi:outer membrane protein assembly factor BamB
MNTLKRCLRSLLLVGVIFLLAQATPLPASDAQLARALRERADQRAALCAVLGHDGNLALELARGSDWLVHVRDPRTEAIAEVLTQSREAGLGIQRLTGERGALSKLPYVDNSVDVVISTTVSPSLLRELNAQEVLRVLRPGGRAILGARKGGSTPPVTGDQLTRWVARAKVPGDVVQDEQGTWIQLTKPERKGVDDWSHWEKGPDNNPVSNDQVIKAPYLTQYMAKPYYIGMPAVTTIAGGRSFLAIGHIAHHRREWNMLNKIIARNGYNGRILWERDLPEGYLVHRSAFIATPDIFYMIGGDVCAMLDTRTGKVLGAIRIPGLEGEWKWMAMQDGVLYVLAGKKDPKVETTKGDREFGGWSWADLSKGYYGKTGNYNRTDIPWGFGHTLAAYDLNQKKLLWKHEEEKPIDSRGLAISDGKFFLICPGSHLHGLSLKDGNVLWTSRDAKVIDLIQAPGQRLRSTPGFKTMCFTVATPKVLIIQGQTRMNVVGLSTATGKLLWTKKKVTNNPNAIFVDGKVIIGVGKGGSHVAIDPVTGEEVEDLGFLKRACTRLTASPDSFFCRGEGLMRFDRQSRKMLIDGSARPGCNDGAIPANGLLYLGPWQCDCNLSLIGNIAQ